ncbi:hypothetical protein Rsub_01731 [Raphidocelis subcapitata]|uniref:Rad21/Rec8-like protein N-terminal domain-containing protein n=1 Tax=Raphidocelis subcapitata TaxID=307507 RepID=A0A2V0NTE0_9CHLO|nr:hypothetical protein Rsub_01731 [Raphidocelis subcapitata]|eukprot:GBF88830.1 hypothetical protein Rsub_01731 [Raphidocelis subcapitata]
MFYAKEILSSKAPLGVIWTLAHGRKISKNKIIGIDLEELCRSVLEPDAPFALRLQGILINGIVCVYERKQAYLLRDLQDMRRRVETAALPPTATVQPASAAGKGASKRVGGGAGGGGAGAPQGKDTAAFEAITIMEWDLPALEGATPGGGLLLGERGGIVVDFASELFEMPSLDPTASLTATGATATGSRKRRAAGGSGASGSIAAALAVRSGGRGARSAGDELFAAEEGADFGQFGADVEEELLAIARADEVFDAPADDMELFGGDLLGGLLAPPPVDGFGDEPMAFDEPPPFDDAPEAATPGRRALPSAGGSEQRSASEAGGAVPAAEEAGGKGRAKKLRVKRRANAPVIDPASDLQISSALYRDWVRDPSHATGERLRLAAAQYARAAAAGGGGDDAGGASPAGARNNAAAGGFGGPGAGPLLPACAFAGLAALAAGGAPLWADATVEAFRLCTGAAAGAAAARGAARGAGGPAGGDDVLLFRDGDADGGGPRRGGGGGMGDGGGREDAARAAKRGRFGELPLARGGEGGFFDEMDGFGLEEDFAMGEANDAVGELAFGGDIETERLRAGPTGSGGAGAGAAPFPGRGRSSTPGSSFGAGGRAAASGSETSLLAPESAPGGGRGGAARRGGELERFFSSGEEGESPLSRRHPGRAAGGSLRDLLPEAEDEGAPGPGFDGWSEGRDPALPSSQWQLLVESATQHPGLGPEDSMTQATHTAIRVFRSRLLEASRRGAQSVPFRPLAARLARVEAARAFYQVCVTHANGFVRARQDEAYGEIWISAGPRM